MSKDKEQEELENAVDPRLKGMLDAVIDDNDELATTNFHGYLHDKMKGILSQDTDDEE